MKKKIVVFAGNECAKDKESYYYPLAYNTGKLLAKEGFIVVTGGGPGLMNEVAKGAVEAGGETIGVCITVLGRMLSEYSKKRFIFHHLNPRQEKLLSLGNGYLALPGGIGTLYEIAAVLALKRKNEIPKGKPLIIIDGYYQEFKTLMNKMREEGFIDSRLDSLFMMVETPEEAIVNLKNVIEI